MRSFHAAVAGLSALPPMPWAAAADGAAVTTPAWLSGCRAAESGAAGSGEQGMAPAGGTLLVIDFPMRRVACAEGGP